MSRRHTTQSKVQRLLVVAGVVLFALCVASLLVFLVFPGDPCGNDDLRTSVAPNGKLKAVLFRRDCGATTAFSTQLSILPASRELPNEGGNVFVVGGEPTVVVRWIDDSHLSISCGGVGVRFHQLSNFNGVQIAYE